MSCSEFLSSIRNTLSYYKHPVTFVSGLFCRIVFGDRLLPLCSAVAAAYAGYKLYQNYAEYVDYRTREDLPGRISLFMTDFDQCLRENAFSSRGASLTRRYLKLKEFAFRLDPTLNTFLTSTSGAGSLLFNPKKRLTHQIDTLHREVTESLANRTFSTRAKEFINRYRSLQASHAGFESALKSKISRAVLLR